MLAAALVAASLFLLPIEPDRTAAPAPEPRPVSAAQAQSDKPAQQTDTVPEQDALPEDGSYTERDDVALYLLTYGHLPGNFITKAEARALGWPGGGLEEYAPIHPLQDRYHRFLCKGQSHKCCAVCGG